MKLYPEISYDTSSRRGQPPFLDYNPLLDKGQRKQQRSAIQLIARHDFVLIGEYESEHLRKEYKCRKCGLHGRSYDWKPQNFYVEPEVWRTSCDELAMEEALG